MRSFEYADSSRKTTPIPGGSFSTRTTSPMPSMVSMSSMMTVKRRFTRVPMASGVLRLDEDARCARCSSRTPG